MMIALMKKLTRLFVIIATAILLLSSTSCDLLFPTITNTPYQHVEGTLEVYFLDVGQADCILIKTDGYNMLIDAGDLRQDSLVLGYLEKYGVTKLDYLVATHPDADHIGSMASVVKKMDSIGQIFMPDRKNNTVTFGNLLSAIQERDMQFEVPEPGDSFMLGEAKVQVLAPGDIKYNNNNNFSIVLRVEFGASTFLFAGDAEDRSENDQLGRGLPLKADVIKVGHHGSDTSSTQQYLNAVKPSYAVISCGAGNSYGHPNTVILERLMGVGALIYRTDMNGTIIFTTDGSRITISLEKGSVE
jgi:competence protein ComEC